MRPGYCSVVYTRFCLSMSYADQGFKLAGGMGIPDVGSWPSRLNAG